MREVSCPLMVRMRCSVISLCNLESCWKRMFWVYPECIHSRRESGALDGGNYGWCTAQIHCLLYATGETAADDAFMDERFARLEPPGAGKMGEARRGAR